MSRFPALLIVLIVAAAFVLPARAQEEMQTVIIPLNLPDGATQLELTLIPAGSFTMGTPLNAPARWPEEFQPHRVTISQPFYLGRFEVTQAQWRAIMDANPSRYRLGDNHPVERVSWENAQEFISKLNEMNLAAGEFRLPTEAEWEYAYLAGAETRFYWGEDLNYQELGDYAWFNLNSNMRHKPVGQILPNNWGLYDMAGNVFEWVEDHWQRGYAREDVTDPLFLGTNRRHVIKGGAFSHNDHRCRAAWRYYADSRRRFHGYGFRLAMTPVEVLEASLTTPVDDWALRD